MRTDTGKIFRLEDYKPTDYAINHVRMVFQLDSQATRVTTNLDIERRNNVDTSMPLVLDGDDLKLLSLSINGQALLHSDYDVTPDLLTIYNLPQVSSFRIDLVTEIRPNTNKALMGLYITDGVFCTQCEAEGFRRITYFLDRPDILATYSVRLEGQKKTAPLLLSNGNPSVSGDLDNGWHFAEWEDPHPKPSYLFALVAGDLGVLNGEFVTRSGRRIELRIYVEHGKAQRATYAMDALKRSMKWDEEKFGREYDLSIFMIVAVSSFNMGAMENKGLNIFNDKYVLADPETATDADYASIEAIIAHEYFHNWTGNRITCRDWFQLCLKEGLTVYRDHEFSADMRSPSVKRIAEVRTLKSNQFPEDQGPLAHPVRPRKYSEINNFYTSTVYEKGSELVRMIRIIIGETAFFAGMDLYFDRFDGQAVTIEDFIACFAEVTTKDLTQFSLWYHQAGTPTLIANAHWDRATKICTLEFEQSSKPTPGESRKKPMHIPVKFGLVDLYGNAVVAKTVEGSNIEGDIIHVKKKRQKITFHGLDERPIASLLRGFSAPVNLAFEQSVEERMILALHDDDLYSRWQALNMLATDALIMATNNIRGKEKPTFSKELLSVFGKITTDVNLEPAFRALCLTLPQEGDVAREIGINVDPETVFSARQALILAIAQSNQDAFESISYSNKPDKQFSTDAESAGQRALNNIILDYLAVKSAKPERAFQAYNASTNMTDRYASLTTLVHRFGRSSETIAALAHFEKTFGDNPLVLDKWFMVQAITPGATCLQTVEKLTNHKGFSFENPNRIRALVGSFASSNPSGFHRTDGAGYVFFANFVLKIDRANPQTAARLLTAMRSWRSLEAVRKEKARQSLVYICSANVLSTDVRDIVERMLA